MEEWKVPRNRSKYRNFAIDLAFKLNYSLMNLIHVLKNQSIAISKRKRTYLISADHFYTYANIDLQKEHYNFTDFAENNIQLTAYPISSLTHGIHVNLSEWFLSSINPLLIKKRKMMILGHDFTLAGRTFP